MAASIPIVQLCLVLLVSQTASSLSCFGQMCDSIHPVCKFEFDVTGYPVDAHCDRRHSHGHPICTSTFPKDSHCHCEDQGCVDRAYALLTTTTTTTTEAQTVPTTVQKMTDASATTITGCIDKVPKCSDTIYMQFVCKDPSPIQVQYNIENCALSCNLCKEYYALHPEQAPTTVFVGTLPTTTITTGSINVQHVCVDRDPKCSEEFYRLVDCKSTDPTKHKYNIETCPVSCSLCNEYHALQTTQIPTTTIPLTTSTQIPTKTTRTPSFQTLCIDHEPKCATEFYRNVECKSTDLTKVTYNVKTCPLSCNLCKEFYALHTTMEPSTVQPCVDLIDKCADPVYKNIICTSTNPDTKAYASQNCQKSCNLCPQNEGSFLQSALGK